MIHPPKKVKQLLFLEKVFLRKMPDVLRGVELFNIELIRDLLRLGYAVDIPADPSWKEAFQAQFVEQKPTVLYGIIRRSLPFNTLAWALALVCRTYDVLLVGNVGHGLIPLLRLLRAFRTFGWFVLIAHRETSTRFMRTLKGAPGHIVAVNGQIAEPFVAAGFPSVQVDYGVTHGDRFFPAPKTPPDAGGVSGRIRFCVVGMLDNAWKGSDTAIAAFRAMPTEIRERAELHLASFSEPPVFEECALRAYPWMPAERIPDWLRTMQVMICPSRDEQVMRETFSQAMVQGMLTGLPILASDLPILREKLDQGGGEVYSDVEDLSQRMAGLVMSSERRGKMGREARETALRRYVWDTARFSERYLERPPDRSVRVPNSDF